LTLVQTSRTIFESNNILIRFLGRIGGEKSSLNFGLYSRKSTIHNGIDANSLVEVLTSILLKSVHSTELACCSSGLTIAGGNLEGINH
jgi:hypothetical protein